MKKRKSCFIWLLCILLLVTALPAVDFTDVQAASVSSTFTGWKTYGGKKYYYKNGKKLTDLHKIGKGMGISEEKINDFFIWAARGIEWQLEGIKLVEEDL